MNVFLFQAEKTSVQEVVHLGKCGYLCFANFFGVPVKSVYETLFDHKHDLCLLPETKLKLLRLEQFLQKHGVDVNYLPEDLFLCSDFSNYFMKYTF